MACDSSRDTKRHPAKGHDFTLTEVLDDDELLESFQTHCKSNHAFENLDFYLHVESLKRLVDSFLYSIDQKQKPGTLPDNPNFMWTELTEKFRSLNTSFIDTKASTEINIPGGLRKKLIVQIERVVLLEECSDNFKKTHLSYLMGLLGEVEKVIEKLIKGDLLFNYFQGQFYKNLLEERKERWLLVIHDEDSLRMFQNMISDRSEEEKTTLQFILELEEYKKLKQTKQLRNKARELIVSYIQPCRILTINEYIIEIEDHIVIENYTRTTFTKIEEHAISVLSKYCKRALIPSASSPTSRKSAPPAVILPPKNRLTSKTLKTITKEPIGLLLAYQNAWGTHLQLLMQSNPPYEPHKIYIEFPGFPHLMYTILFLQLFNLPSNCLMEGEHKIVLPSQSALIWVFGKQWIQKELPGVGEKTEDGEKIWSAYLMFPLTILYKEKSDTLVFDGNYVIKEKTEL